MQVAFISDVHGNSVALESVLDDMPAVDDIVCLGDTIGYGPNPRESVELVREHASVVLQGNHETYFSDPARCKGNDMAYAGIKHAREELTDEQAEWVSSLTPQELLYDDRVLAAHGYPDPETPFQYVRPANVTEMVPYMRESPAEVLTTGHLHVQFKEDLSRFHDDAGLFFNPGSVGQPRDNDPKAAYAVLDTDSMTVALRRVEYAVDTVVEQIEAAGLPEDTGSRLRTGNLNRGRRRL
jgi:predicted phosphodiesterase